MIITVTLNPALDKTMLIDDFSIDRVNREKNHRIDAGGKGINVSKVIKNLGGESLAIGFLSGSSGNFIKERLDNTKISNQFIFTSGETRTNLKIVDLKNKTYTDINEKGPLIENEDLKNFEKLILKYIKEEGVLVLSGSIPENLEKDFYFRIINKIDKEKFKVILDADGELLKEGIKAGPYLVKPNINELEKLFSVRLETREEIIKYARKLLDFGIQIIVVSLGREGSIFVTKESTAIVESLKVNAKSTVGAGDSMVAALAKSLNEKDSLDKMIRLSVASSIAAVMTEGAQAPRLETILKIFDRVKYELI